MKLLVLSPSENISREPELVIALFENGLEIFHVHKPNCSDKEIQSYIRQFPKKYHDKIFLHSDFPKFHSLEEMQMHNEKFEYAFLSPIFDSISKPGYKSKFDHRLHEFSQSKSELISAIGGKSVFALGGIDEDKIEICRELGFAGVAVCGAIWQNKNPLEKFLRIKEKCQKKDLVF